MLRAFPENVIQKFGKAHMFMLMDAMEMKMMNLAFWSSYKSQSTLKLLIFCQETHKRDDAAFEKSRHCGIG
eukprot:scaffold10865_cov67-Attheya_sp.AAC.1